MWSGLRPYLPRIAAFLAIFLVLDAGVEAAFSAVFRHTRYGFTDGAAANMARQARAEVVILGSSRAHRHFDSTLLSQRLGASVYNAGCPGQALPYMRGLVDLLLAAYTPRLFLVHVDPQMLVDLERYGRVATLAPFIGESDVVRDLIYRRSELEWVKYLVRSFRYNNRGIELLRDLWHDDPAVAGYAPRRSAPGLRVLNEVMWPASVALVEDRLADEPDPRRVALLDEIVEAARTAGTEVVLVTSPRWHPGETEHPKRRRLLAWVAEFAESRRLPFVQITLDDTPVFRDPTLFADTQHMNAAGATLFSNMLADRLLELDLPLGHGDSGALAGGSALR